MPAIGIRAKLLWPIVVLGIGLALFSGWYVRRVSRLEAESDGIASAKRLTTQLGDVRAYHSEKVVPSAKAKGVEIAADYASKPGAIPLPATMIHELNARASTKGGYSVRLFSQYPFPLRTDGGARDDFERDAIAELTKHPAVPTSRMPSAAPSAPHPGSRRGHAVLPE